MVVVDCPYLDQIVHGGCDDILVVRRHKQSCDVAEVRVLGFHYIGDFALSIHVHKNYFKGVGNSKKVNWVQVESISIGEITFTNQTAFIGDFEANPILQCLKVDGIIGSNLIRHCNWTIDQEQMSLTLFDNIGEFNYNECITIPFKTDYQYNMFMDMGVGQATIKNVLVDYGSNGTVSFNDEIFTTLKNRSIIDEVLVEKGFIQSGIVGKSVALTREIVYSDSLNINSVYFPKAMLRTGKTVSVGNGFLSRFKVTIDWKNKKLHFWEIPKTARTIYISGCSLAYSIKKGVYIQSVIDNSNAYNKGIRPNMKVLQVDDLDFENGNDFCDYVSHTLGDKMFLKLIDNEGYQKEYHIENTHL